MRERQRVLLVLILLLAGLRPLSTHAAGSEYELKAAFLFYFTKFVEWPATAFADSNSPLILGVIGRDPFGSALDALDGKTVKNRTLKVKRLTSAETLQECHVLFISPSESDRAAEIAKALGSASVLTIGDGLPNLRQQGVMINLLLAENKVKLEINIDTVHRAKISISSQVLQMATVVSEG